MDNEMNQGLGQPADQQPGRETPAPANQQIPPQQVNPAVYTYTPTPAHQRFWERKINVSLWKCLLAGALAVILAFGMGASVGRRAGMRRMMRGAAPFMMQMPDRPQQGFYFNNGNRSHEKGSFQFPNGNSRNSNGNSQNPNGNSQNPKSGFQNPNGGPQNPSGGDQSPNSNPQYPNGGFWFPNGNSQTPNGSYRVPGGNSWGQYGNGYEW